MFNIVLFNPQIPPNTGNIGRLCVNAGAKLHIVKPIGFDISEKAVKRAGLDYWDKLDLTVWESTDEFLKHVDTSRCFFATTKTDKPYFEVEYKPGDYIIFGSETKGIDENILRQNFDNCITIPMTKEGRSLNLAVSTGIILYEAIRQNFKGSL
ncbi:RNA methyltransferase, TrmH family, group 2 [Nautilia profundicola AmH]|uniref:Putative tRNA (cytidine(34)-2'-O)-methyltransferase n=1 Tax=Nautilia profundicola (strain ATCC BAA-1463 / DSM 18972 / AmH) TaxID=598659 RepID=B9L5K9_NAUPA|nr:tRNA (cytidine(34)-2'-O)-methyltransferase [Nautilia profundicola]ACM93206.1 RNA methyltransferase, TrmH family, group 2 [Nautilia profundicola AmH]